MAQFAESVLLPVLLGGPLLVVCSWLLWLALGRPFANRLRPTKSDVRAAVPCLVLLAASGGLCVGVNVVADFIREREYRAYLRHENVREAYLALEHYQMEHHRPPAGLQDIEACEAFYERGIAAVRVGEVVVLWGRPTTEFPTEPVIVAHEKLDGRKNVLVAWSDGRITHEDPGAVPRLVGTK